MSIPPSGAVIEPDQFTHTGYGRALLLQLLLAEQSALPAGIGEPK